MKELFQFNKQINEKKVKYLAKRFMKEYCILAGDQKYFFAEVEFYYHSKYNDHQDHYCHRNDCQAEFGRWYHHGSGLDITFGEKHDSTKKKDWSYGGILIRGLFSVDIAGNETFTSGPLNVLNELFTALGPVESRSFLQLIQVENKYIEEDIIAVKRIGLSAKKEEYITAEYKRFHTRKYRFIANYAHKQHRYAQKTKVINELFEAGGKKEEDFEFFENKFWRNIITK